MSTLAYPSITFNAEEPIKRYLRRIIKIRASDSPNVRYAEAEKSAGKKISHREIVPGVVTYREYKSRRRLWDEVKQCIALDANFYEGSENLLFPPIWLDLAEQQYREYEISGNIGNRRSGRRAIGIDPGEGVASTSMFCVDHLGVLAWHEEKTPDTSGIVDKAINFMLTWDVDAEFVMWDRGGGGKQLSDEMCKRGHRCRNLGFGEAVDLETKRGLHTIADRQDVKEERGGYFNRRAQMYGELSELMDPSLCQFHERLPFALPYMHPKLRKELSPVPKLYDKEGKIKLPPKNQTSDNSKEKSLTQIIGWSPDNGDALVLAVHSLLNGRKKSKAGSAVNTTSKSWMNGKK
jgi:hypothetical protein